MHVFGLHSCLLRENLLEVISLAFSGLLDGSTLFSFDFVFSHSYLAFILSFPLVLLEGGMVKEDGSTSGYADEMIFGIEVIKGDAGKKWPCSNVRKGKIERVHFLIKKKLHLFGTERRNPAAPVAGAISLV